MLESVLDSVAPWLGAAAFLLFAMTAASLALTDLAGPRWTPPDTGSLQRLRRSVLGAAMTARRLRVIMLGGTVGLTAMAAMLFGFAGQSTSYSALLGANNQIRQLQREIRGASERMQRALDDQKQRHDRETEALREQHERERRQLESTSQDRIQIGALEAQNQIRDLQTQITQRDQAIAALQQDLQACGCQPSIGGQFTPIPGVRPNLGTQ